MEAAASAPLKPVTRPADAAQLVRRALDDAEFARFPDADLPRGGHRPHRREEGAAGGPAGAAAARARPAVVRRATTRSSANRRRRTSACGCSTASAPTRRTSSASRRQFEFLDERVFPALEARGRRRTAAPRARLERRLLHRRGALLAGHVAARRAFRPETGWEIEIVGHRPLDPRAASARRPRCGRSRRPTRSRRATCKAFMLRGTGTAGGQDEGGPRDPHRRVRSSAST